MPGSSFISSFRRREFYFYSDSLRLLPTLVRKCYFVVFSTLRFLLFVVYYFSWVVFRLQQKHSGVRTNPTEVVFPPLQETSTRGSEEE